MRKISNREDSWGQIFSESLSRVGTWEWPRPDYVIDDNIKKCLIASEFKPPGWEKREYVTGLGQCITYLERHHYAMLVVPSVSNDGFQIGDYLGEVLKLNFLQNTPVSLVQYDPKKIYADVSNSISLTIPINNERTDEPPTKKDPVRTYWAFWRDISQYEVLEMLELSDKYRNEDGDIYTEKIFPEFFDKKCAGKTMNWEGKPRSIKSGHSESAEKQNNKIPLFHLNLWDQAEGRLTFEGYRLINIGRRYGADSPQFKEYLAQILLTEGNHLDLIYHIQNYQDSSRKELKKINKSEEYRKRVEEYLDNKNLIGKRKPRRTTTGAKGSFIRDEFKVWNKLGLLKLKSQSQYFYPGMGLVFDWKRITEIMTTDFSKF
jgi:hypothetical protein